MADPLGAINNLLGPAAPAGMQRVGGPGPTGEVAQAFADVLKTAMSQLQQDQSTAQGMINQFTDGGPIDVSQVTIAMEQASLALQLLIEVRNQIINAHETLMRMPV